jgi:hypothetical protein
MQASAEERKKSAIRPGFSAAEAMADLLKEIRNEKQEVLLLHRESRKRINRGGARVVTSSSKATKPPALW